LTTRRDPREECAEALTEKTILLDPAVNLLVRLKAADQCRRAREQDAATRAVERKPVAALKVNHADELHEEVSGCG